jgi:predicted RNase H-like HicB family nuclease
MTRRKIQMHYHYEPEGWWAESPELPGFSAAGATFEEVREQAHEGAAFFADEPLEIEDRAPVVSSTNACSSAASVGLAVRLTVGEHRTETVAGLLVPRLKSALEKVTAQSAHVHMEPAERVG